MSDPLAMLDLDVFNDAPQVTHTQDTIKLAVPPAVVGCGGCGNNLADEYWKAGCRSVLALNLTEQDMQHLSLPSANRYLFGGEVGGAGKNTEIGAKHAEAHFEDIVRAMIRIFSPEAKQVQVCIGANGGTGAGAFKTLVKAARVAMKVLHPQDFDDIIFGALIALPGSGEGNIGRINTARVLRQVDEMLNDGTLDNAVYADNTRFEHLPRMTLSKLYPIVNQTVVQQLISFNYIAGMTSGAVRQFDPANYRVILRAGLLHFGTMLYEPPADLTGLSTADLATIMRSAFDSERSTLLKEVDTTHAGAVGCLLYGQRGVVDSVETGEITRGLEALERLVSDKNFIYNGVYYYDSAPNGKLCVSTILGGVKIQQKYWETHVMKGDA